MRFLSWFKAKNGAVQVKPELVAAKPCLAFPGEGHNFERSCADALLRKDAVPGQFLSVYQCAGCLVVLLVLTTVGGPKDVWEVR